MLEVVGQDIISGNMGFIGTDPGREYQMGAAEKTEDVTVTGNPAVLDNAAGKPFKDLHIYGRSEQMTTTGAQLIDINSLQKNNDISVKIVNNYSIELTSTIKKDASDSSRVYLNATIDADILVGKTITMSYDGWNSNVPNETIVCGIMYNINGKNNYESIASDSRIKTVTIPLGAKDCKARLFLIEDASATVKAGTYTAIIKGIMICEGTVAKSWEPYTGGKPSPSPDYPQEIVSAGEGGSVTVKVTGRNILDMRNSKESVANSGVTYTRNADYSFTRTGTATEALGNVWMAGGYLVKPKADLSNVLCVLLKGVKYSIKDCVLLTVSPAGNALAARNENFVPTQDMYITGVRNENFIVGETYNDIVYPAVYVGEKALQYEPYREQLLTIPTPNGLPGIPVTAGGNYTDQSGQQWICDEVDLGRGVYVQRVDKGAFDATKALTEQSVILATPIETPLATAEIAAYKSLRTYRGTTFVEAEDKAGISVTYKRNAKTDNVSAEKKIEESEKKEYDES